MYEINGNLSKIEHYLNFQVTITNVIFEFTQLFGGDLMSKYPFYVDNCSNQLNSNCGHTPIITPVFKQFLIVKLGVDNFSDTPKIIFQFAHELTHFVFYCIKGIDKEIADHQEEKICTAMSLIMLKTFCDYNTFNIYCDYVKALEYVGYKDGYDLASSLGFDKIRLSEMIQSF